MIRPRSPVIGPLSSTAASFNNEPSSADVDLDVVEETPEELMALGRAEFQHQFSFPLDDWQWHAGGALVRGCNVIVAAPTGAGKTVVGEMALHTAFQINNQNNLRPILLIDVIQ